MQRVDGFVLVVTRTDVEVPMRIEVPLVIDEERLGFQVGTERREQDRVIVDGVDIVRERQQDLPGGEIARRRGVRVHHQVRWRLVVV